MRSGRKPSSNARARRVGLGLLSRCVGSAALVLAMSGTPVVAADPAPASGSTPPTLAAEPYNSPIGSWPDTYTVVTAGPGTGQRYNDPTTITSYDPATGAFSGKCSFLSMVGVLHGTTWTATISGGGYVSHHQGTIKFNPDGSAIWTGTWTDSNGASGTWYGTRAKGKPSAVLVICNRDLSLGETTTAVFACNAFVADASGGDPLLTPGGSLTWSAPVGSFTPPTCDLKSVNYGMAGCGVTFKASATAVPEGTPPPVTATYGGDKVFWPSAGTDQLGGAIDLSNSDLDGPDDNPTRPHLPKCKCGDPVSPATGNLSLSAGDLVVPGLGAGLALVRTYNSDAAARVGSFGAGWTSSYDAHLTLATGSATVRLGSGATVEFTRNASGFLAAAWSTASLTQVGSQYVLTFANQNVEIFDTDGNLVALTDRTGERTTLTYAAGRLSTVTDASGRKLNFTTNAAGHIVTATDPAGRKVSYGYDAAQNLVSVTDVAGNKTLYAYDAGHRMVSTTDPMGAVAKTNYDAAGRVSSQVDPLGHTLSFTYAGSGTSLMTTATDGEGHRSVTTYQGGLLMSKVTALGTPAQTQVSYLYNARAQLIGTIDANGHLWSETVDAVGNVLTATDPLGRTTTYTYDARNDLTSVVDPLGIVSKIDYDNHGQPVQSVVAVGTAVAATTKSTYSTAHPGELTSRTDATGAVTTFHYDAYGDMTVLINALGGLSTSTYNVLGQETSTVGALGNQPGASATSDRTTYTYDAYGNVVHITGPLGTSTTSTYDADQRLVSITAPNGKTTKYTYDANGNPASKVLPDGSSQGAKYDAVGDVVTTVDGAGKLTSTAYDGAGRAISRTDASGGVWANHYDAAGNVTSTTNPSGTVTSYTYDAANELVGISYGDGSTAPVAYTYDADGRRVSMTDGTGKTTYTYDAQSRLVATTDGAGHTIATTYDARGDVLGVTYPNGLKIAQQFDKLGRLVSVTDGLGHTNRFSYDADSRETKATLGNGTTITYAYNDDGAVTAITDAGKSGTSFASYSYTRGALDEITSFTDPANTKKTAVTYDTDSRLTGLGDQTYSTDASGNLTSINGAKASYNKLGQLTALAGSSATAFTYNSADERTSETSSGKTLATYGYDGDARLVKVTSKSGASSYTYNGDGLRMSATGPASAKSSFTWDLSGGSPLLLGDGTYSFVYGPGGAPLEQISGTGTSAVARWLYADQQGSVRVVADDKGTPVETIAYSAYGVMTAHTGTLATPLGFDGQYTDQATGLQYLQHRYYDPATAQFLTIDPAVAQTHAAYSFASSDPLDFGDPTGLGLVLTQNVGKIEGIDLGYAQARYANEHGEAVSAQPGTQPGWFTGGSHTVGGTVLSGHGMTDPNNGYIAVPQGTWITFHTPPGTAMMGDLGQAVDKGQPTIYNETYGPGDLVPNMVLVPASGGDVYYKGVVMDATPLDITPGTVTVDEATELVNILKPNMGDVQWSACRSYAATTDINGDPSAVDRETSGYWGINGDLRNQ